MLGGRAGLVGIQQALRQPHAVLRGGRQFVSFLRIAQRPARVKRVHGRMGYFADFAFNPQFGQINGKEIHDAAQHGKHEQNQQPIQLAPTANGVNGKKDRRDDMHRAQIRNGKIKHAKPLR